MGLPWTPMQYMGSNELCAAGQKSHALHPLRATGRPQLLLLLLASSPSPPHDSKSRHWEVAWAAAARHP